MSSADDDPNMQGPGVFTPTQPDEVTLLHPEENTHRLDQLESLIPYDDGDDIAFWLHLEEFSQPMAASQWEMNGRTDTAIANYIAGRTTSTTDIQSPAQGPSVPPPPPRDLLDPPTSILHPPSQPSSSPSSSSGYDTESDTDPDTDTNTSSDNGQPHDNNNNNKPIQPGQNTPPETSQQEQEQEQEYAARRNACAMAAGPKRASRWLAAGVERVASVDVEMGWVGEEGRKKRRKGKGKEKEKKETREEGFGMSWSHAMGE